MPSDIPLRCACGKLRGVAFGVSPRSGCRVVCYCDDCQAFARFLGRPDITDPWGGTDIFQMAPAKVRITSGADSLGCIRLSNKGMHRWYCAQCMTPVGNTVSARLPFVGIVHNFMNHAAPGHSRDEVLGQPIGYVQTKFALGAPPPRGGFLLRVIARSAWLLGKWWLIGAGTPSPFYDERTRAPRVQPRILDPRERSALAAPSTAVQLT